MTDTLDAVEVSGKVRDSYLRYLRSLLPLQDQNLEDAVHRAIGAGDALVKGPLLEATPPYKAGASIQQLIKEGVLSGWLDRLDTANGLPLNRPLYLHQEQAIRRAVTGRNMVVATGTGSGKTESFLLPVMEHLAKEAAAGTLGQPGVRALLLYPMNALANDQLKRLRGLLTAYPEVTFGRYTGETKHTQSDAEDLFRHQFPGEPRLPNELLSREQMQDTPPHLLLTNYAMLEYLLLRPSDTALFDGATGDHWRFIVLDEAHVYDGASGIEVAMLLRRLADRVSGDRELQAIATSATVGGSDAGPDVAGFASTLLSLPFEYDPADPVAQDVIWATREEPDAVERWGPLPEGAYADLLAVAPSDRSARLAELAPNAPSASLVDVLASEQRIAQARELLATGPRPIREVAAVLFGGGGDALVHTSALVSLCAGTHDHGGSPLLPARYHLWARATEGAFACLSASPHASLVRTERCQQCDSPTFEVASCKRCSATYLVGSEQVIGTAKFLIAPSANEKRLRWYILLPDGASGAVTANLADEDDVTLEGFEDLTDHEAMSVCCGCGRLNDSGVRSCQGCGGGRLRELLRLDAITDPRRCGLCGGVSNAGQIRRLNSGADASGSVLATAVYQSLPVGTDPEHQQKPGAGRKLLLFSDSRQDAAYFAPSFEGSYGQLLRRSMVLTAVLQEARPDEPVDLEDVANRVRKLASDGGVFAWGDTAATRRITSATWVAAEAVSVSAAQSLEGLGLIAFGFKRKPGLEVPAPLLELGIDRDLGWSLVMELLRSVRTQGVMSVPDGVDPRDDVFMPRIGPIRLRGQGPEPKRKILSWLPGKGRNSRVDYLSRIALKSGADVDATNILEGLWRWLSQGPAKEYLAQVTEPGLGVVGQLNHQLLTVRPVTGEDPVFRCSRCRRTAPVSVLGVCATMGCAGALEFWAPPASGEDDDHYRRLARDLAPIPLSVSEHTAQFRSEEAAKIQQAFIDADLNALSCSTTFELGVDVGELQAVILRNVPPATSNYVQRAGRAGRRTDSAALVVTYAQRRSHDLTFFENPVEMIAGRVKPPRVDLRNERIAARHAQAIALAAWFREEDAHGQSYKDVTDLHGAEDGQEPPDLRLIGWLGHPPKAVIEAIQRTIPVDLHKAVGVTDGSWASRMADLVRDIGEQHRNDIAIYLELQDQAAGEKKFQKAGMYGKVMNTLNRRYLLSHLASKNILPKYGFPVDTVELRTGHLGTQEASRLDLGRDLRMAISDYAPGTELVAGGYLWESGGVYRLPNREFPRRWYVACKCGYYREELQEFIVEQCAGCEESHRSAVAVRSYIVPEFGFLAVNKPAKRPTKKPLRSYASAVHLVTSEHDGVDEQLELASGVTVEHRYVERGELAVINAGWTGSGYLICKWCGTGRPNPDKKGRGPKSHKHLMTGRDCSGSEEWVSLGHRFETDVLELRLRGTGMPRNASVWHGVLSALVEAAAERFSIARDDLDGTLHFGADGKPPTIVLYDDVPAGAGHVRRIRNDLEGVLRDAHDRVRNCVCGPETSCYRCLRGFRNQRFHDELRRGAVADLLGRALGDGRAVPVQLVDVNSGDLGQFDGQFVVVHIDGNELEGTIWVESIDGEVESVILQDADGATRDLDPASVKIRRVGVTA